MESNFYFTDYNFSKRYNVVLISVYMNAVMPVICKYIFSLFQIRLLFKHTLLNINNYFFEK